MLLAANGYYDMSYKDSSVGWGNFFSSIQNVGFEIFCREKRLGKKNFGSETFSLRPPALSK